MTWTGGPFDGAPWSEANWFDHMPAAMPSGVIGTKPASATAGELAWSSSGLSITLAAGRANVGGAGAKNAAPLGSVAVTANTNASLSRRDRIVLRRDLGTHGATPVVIQGTPSASPVAPNITTNSTVFDLKLFSFLVPPNSGTSITGVVDERTWINDGTSQIQPYSSLFLGKGSGTTGSAGDTATTIASAAVTVPSSLDPDRRVEIRGFTWASTPNGVGLVIVLTGSNGFSVSRAINAGSLNGDFVIEDVDTDLTAGARTYSLRIQTTVTGQTLDWREPRINVKLI